MKVQFAKMHGAGNDYVYIDLVRNRYALRELPALARRLSDRHTGIGSDGLILIHPSAKADFSMEMYNADGSMGEMCGNGIRCVAKYVYDTGLTAKKIVDIETASGIKRLWLSVSGGKVARVRVDMGEPSTEPGRLPVASDIPVIGKPLATSQGTFRVTCVSMGNPHCVAFVDRVTDELVLKAGPEIERHRLFPKRVNVEFVKVLSKSSVEMRVWERGTGETLACGTGSCAAVVAAALNRKTGRKVRVKVLGGQLDIEWAEDNHVYMSGPAELAFEGEVEVRT